MRPIAAIVVLILAAGCATQPGAAPTALLSPTASPVSTPVVSPAASTTLSPTALPNLAARVAADLPLTVPWPHQRAVVAFGSLWIPDTGESGPAALNRLDPNTLEVMASIELGSEAGAFPPDGSAVAATSEGVWVTLGFQHAIAFVDPETNEIVRRIEVGGDPYGITFDGSNLWVANFEADEVVRVDPGSGDIVARFDVAGPTEIAIGENTIWVSEHFEGRATRIDPLTNEVVSQLPVGGRPGVFVALGSLWARSNDRKTVTRIDPDSEETVAIIEVPSNPYDIDLADGSIWVTVSPQRGACERNSHLVRIDPSTNMVDGAIAVPCAFSIVSDGERLWATGGGSMVRIDP